jgi:hypothetical protein
VSNFEDWLANTSKTAYEENVTLKILVNRKRIIYHGVHEAILENGVFTGYNEVDLKKTSIQYTKNDDVSGKMKNDRAVFEFLYNYDKEINEPCCMVGFQYDRKLGVAMTVLIY